MIAWLINKEILLALRLGALGRWWAAHAVRRLERVGGKFSVKGSDGKVLK